VLPLEKMMVARESNERGVLDALFPVDSNERSSHPTGMNRP
jgi:hypothetical protein